MLILGGCNAFFVRAMAIVYNLIMTLTKDLRRCAQFAFEFILRTRTLTLAKRLVEHMLCYRLLMLDIHNKIWHP